MADTKPPQRASAPDLAILGDNLHLHPSSIDTSPSSPALPPTAGTEQELLEPYARFRKTPINALQELGSHALGTGWRSYDNFIGQEIFYPGFSEQMTRKVMAQERLRGKIADLAARKVEREMEEGMLGPLGLEGEEAQWVEKRKSRRGELERQLTEVAERWTDGMICKMDSRVFIRGAYYFATQLLTRAYHQGIHVNSEEVLQLRGVAETAAKKRQSLIFLPCHRSHVDYVSLQVICYRLGLALPTVVAGDNLNIPVLGAFLQHAGAMWLRRSFGDDALYQTLVQAYMDTLLQSGHSIECFIEGGRSRTGKLLQPKFGILSFLLESVLSGTVEDAIVVPVSTQYDKVIEVDSYISELLGQPKPKENLSSFLSASNVLSLKLGRVDVRFHKPWSLRGFIDEHQGRLQQRSLQGATREVALKRRLLTTLGYKVLSDINDASVVMPTALVGTVLLTLRGRGVGKSELVRKVDWLSAKVRAQNGRVAHLTNTPTEVVVDRALAVLGPKLVGKVHNLPEDTFYAVDRFQLSFYRNMTIHLFVSQALVCAALYTKVKVGGGSQTQRITYAELRDYVFFLSQLFRSEFIFPTTPLEENLSQTLSGLESDQILSSSPESEAHYISLHPLETASGRETFDFHCFQIWPFIEATWLGAISLFMLTPPPGVETSTPIPTTLLQNTAQLLGKTLYHQGDLSYFEAVNKESLKNALQQFLDDGVILLRAPSPSSSSSAPVPKNAPAAASASASLPPKPGYVLAPEFLPPRDSVSGLLVPEGRLWVLAQRLGEARREGKGRRDGATVVGRVLGLCEVVGRGMWGEVLGVAGGGGGGGGGGDGGVKARL
ncbi:hypothetical protein MBLNU230_g2970t1 [Neophaeotheca triangularis]